MQTTIPEDVTRRLDRAEARGVAMESRITVLVVDHEDLFRNMIADLLRERGHTVFTAAGRDEVFAILERQPEIALVFLHTNLRGPSGIAVFEEIMRQSNPPRVIMMTGTEETEIFRVMKAGAAGFLIKPFSLGDMENAIASALPGGV